MAQMNTDLFAAGDPAAVQAWLFRVKRSDLWASFEADGYDTLVSVSEMTWDDDLAGMRGIKRGFRRGLLRAIAELKATIGRGSMAFGALRTELLAQPAMAAATTPVPCSSPAPSLAPLPAGTTLTIRARHPPNKNLGQGEEFEGGVRARVSPSPPFPSQLNQMSIGIQEASDTCEDQPQDLPDFNQKGGPGIPKNGGPFICVRPKGKNDWVCHVFVASKWCVSKCRQQGDDIRLVLEDILQKTNFKDMTAFYNLKKK